MAVCIGCGIGIPNDKEFCSIACEQNYISGGDLIER